MISGTAEFGTVIAFNARRGFGFIKPRDADVDVFVHSSRLREAGLDALQAGQQVRFVRHRDRRGWYAARVRLVPSEPFAIIGGSPK